MSNPKIVSFRVNPNLLSQIDTAASELGVSRSTFVLGCVVGVVRAKDNPVDVDADGDARRPMRGGYAEGRARAWIRLMRPRVSDVAVWELSAGSRLAVIVAARAVDLSDGEPSSAVGALDRAVRRLCDVWAPGLAVSDVVTPEDWLKAG